MMYVSCAIEGWLNEKKYTKVVEWSYQVAKTADGTYPQDYIIKSCTISMTLTGKYYVSILTEYEKEIVQKDVETVVGLDFTMGKPITLGSIVTC